MSTNYGRCDCGSIEYEFQDDPINTVFCYCKTCQLHTNSDKWFGVWVLARSKEAKHYGLKCLSTPLLPLIGLLFLKEFQNMTLSRPADKYLINPFLKV